MKKKFNFRRFFGALLLFTALVGGVSLVYLAAGHAVSADLKAESDTETVAGNFLVLGVDAAAENTDVILLCNLQEDKVKLLQIPRDTYVNCQEGKGKINQFYNKYLGRSGDKRRAAEQTAALLSQLLGLPINGYLVVDTDTVANAVDALGGVTVKLTHPIPYTDPDTGEGKRLEVGEQHINGREAIAYLRYRKGYATGDLGRLEAQIAFYNGLLKSLRQPRGWQEYLTIYQKIAPNLLTNLSEKDIIKFMIGYLRERDLPDAHVMRLAGEPTVDERGASYYVLHRKTAERMLAEHFDGNGALGMPEAFTRTNSETFMNIYTVPSSPYLVYLLEKGGEPKTVRQ